MSDPKNPLDAFRTYAYHHVLVACDGTQTADDLSTETEITRFDHEGADQKFCPQLTKSGRYVVLINGMSDAQFAITSVDWTNVLIPKVNSSGEDTSTTSIRMQSVEGELKIQEPLGVNFMNVLNEVTKSLGVDPTALVFVLKTIFIGHRDDGTTEVRSDIRPLMFIAFDITALFETTGAEYTMNFVGVSNGAAQLPHNTAVADGFSWEIPTGQKDIGTLCTLLAMALNDYYGRTWASVAAQGKCFNSDYDISNEFIKVKYAIIPDSFYAGLNAGDADNSTKSTTGDSDTVISGDSLTVESIIGALMNTSQSVIDADSKIDSDGTQYQFRIASEVSIGEEYVVTYFINRWEGKVVRPSEVETFTPPKDPKTKTPVGITFNYIFTGENIDVISFDLKMQMGLAFFQTLSAESSLPSGANQLIKHYNPSGTISKGNLDGHGGDSGNGVCENDARNQSKFRKKPLFLGMGVKDSTVRNKRYATTAANYDAMLERFAAYENIEALMTIRGNPQLLEESNMMGVNMTTDPNKYEPIPIVQFGNGDARNVFPKLHNTPGFVKVNVRMPNAALVPGADQMYADDYTRPFWYQGWYQLLSIQNSFDGGEFTQTLTMYSLPTDSSQNEQNKECVDDQSVSARDKPTATENQPVAP